MLNFRNCLVKNDPPRIYGDCIAACLRSITDDDSIPHVFDGRSGEEAWHQIRSYLKSKGKNLALFVIPESPLEYMGLNNPGIPYMLLASNAGGNHAVVGLNDIVVHDPAWYPTELIGPIDAGVYIIGVVTA